MRNRIRNKWAIYFTWSDGFHDSLLVKDANERDANIRQMIARGEFQEISYCRIYANGEYGTRTTVLGR